MRYLKRIVKNGNLIEVSGRKKKQCDGYVTIDSRVTIQVLSLLQLIVDNDSVFFVVGLPMKTYDIPRYRHFPSHISVMGPAEAEELVAVRTTTHMEKCVTIPLDSSLLAVSVIPNTAWGD